MSLKNLKIVTKVLISPVLLAAVAVGGITYAAMGMNRIAGTYSELINGPAQAVIIGTRLRRIGEQYRGDLYRLIAETDDAQIKQVADQIASTAKEYSDNGDKLKALVPDFAARVDDVEKQFADVVAASQEPIQLATANKNEEATKVVREKVNPMLDATVKASDDLRNAVSEDMNAHSIAAATEVSAIVWTTAISIAVALLTALAIAVWISLSGIARPLGRLGAIMGRLAEGDASMEIEGIDRKDEIGGMAKTVEVFKANKLRADALAAEQAREQEVKERRAKAMAGAITEFETMIGMVSKGLAAASTELNASAQNMSTIAEETSRQAGAVASASAQASANVQTVAASGEELSASIAEISRQVNQSSAVARKAVEEAQRTDAKVQGLAEAAQKIGEVVGIISDIAAQTNLLALNATIEAARAGEAGKGFAVVASEVKNLASQTSKATDEITAQITGIQGATRESVDAIKLIGQTINEINGIATAIASAIEEQGAATQEISRNVQEAARGTQDVTSNISGVTHAAGETGNNASHVLSASGELAKQTDDLRRHVDTFLAKVRAA